MPESKIGSIKVYRDPQKEQGEDTYFFNMKAGTPVELGNGSFGIVFAVSERRKEAAENKGSHALKIFYSKDYKTLQSPQNKTKSNEDDTQNRFILEHTYFDRINDLWFESYAPDGLIKPGGATTNFLKSDVYEKLFQLESLSHIKVSNYAILLPRYHGSLKDLLETKISGNKLTGYEALESCNFHDRISSAIPFINSIVGGLEALYTGEHAHLDIKPANIFFKKLGPQSFEVVLADIGYINPIRLPIDINTGYEHTIEYENVMRLGTRHYRSPEQKYYSDVCEAEVKKDAEGKVYVIIKDPKFKDTLITKGDYLSFSKYDSQSLKTVEEFDGPKGSNNEIKIKVGRIGPTERGEIKSEPKTQVVFYKRQYIKTDLFGIGAILFDIITAGESPEYFYESIRKLDNEKESVKSIITLYEEVIKSHGKHPAHHYFEDLKHKKTEKYAPKLAVEFILKCMLYKAKGTYFNLKELGTANLVLKPASVFKEINFELSSKYFPEIMQLNNHLNNVIVFPNKVRKNHIARIPIIDVIPQKENLMDEKGDRLREISSKLKLNLKKASQQVRDRVSDIFPQNDQEEEVSVDPSEENAIPIEEEISHDNDSRLK